MKKYSKNFDAILSNNIMQKTYAIGEWEQISGSVDNSEKIKELKKS